MSAHRFIAFILLAALATVPRVIGGTCAPGLASTRERLANFDAVFIGRVVDIRPGDRAQPFGLVVLEVKSAWKGVTQPNVTVRDHPIFSTGFVVGKQYLVFARVDPACSMLTVMNCGETNEVSKSRVTIAELGDPGYRPEKR
jgi:hypothetical protein